MVLKVLFLWLHVLILNASSAFFFCAVRRNGPWGIR